MNHEEMSDFSVNKRLTELLGMKIISRPMSQSMNDLFDEAEEDDVFGCVGDLAWKFNYCNNWQDIGPLIDTYGLVIDCRFGTAMKTFEDAGQDIVVSCRGDTKRAAAICIIKLLERKK